MEDKIRGGVKASVISSMKISCVRNPILKKKERVWCVWLEH
jgi:hypothetical protein